MVPITFKNGVYHIYNSLYGLCVFYVRVHPNAHWQWFWFKTSQKTCHGLESLKNGRDNPLTQVQGEGFIHYATAALVFFQMLDMLLFVFFPLNIVYLRMKTRRYCFVILICLVDQVKIDTGPSKNIFII